MNMQDPLKKGFSTFSEIRALRTPAQQLVLMFFLGSQLGGEDFDISCRLGFALVFESSAAHDSRHLALSPKPYTHLSSKA